MLSTGAAFMDVNGFLATPPGVAIILTVLLLDLLGEMLRDSIGRGIASAGPPRVSCCSGADPTRAGRSASTRPRR